MKIAKYILVGLAIAYGLTGIPGGGPPAVAEEKKPIVSDDRPEPLADGKSYASPAQEALHLAWAAYAERERGKAYDILAPHADGDPPGTGDPHIDALMGRILLYGPDAIQNPAEALARLQNAADHDYMHAAYTLGRTLTDGTETSQDLPKGLSYLEKAAECGMPNAHAHLAYLYSGKDGVEQDWMKAKSHARIAAYAGNADMQGFYAVTRFMLVNTPGAEVPRREVYEIALWISLGAQNGSTASLEGVRELRNRPEFKVISEYLGQDLNDLGGLISQAEPKTCGFTHPPPTDFD